VFNESITGVFALFSPDDKLSVGLKLWFKEALSGTINIGMSQFNMYYKLLGMKNKVHKAIIGNKPHFRISHPSPAFIPTAGEHFVRNVMKWAEQDNLPVYHEVYSMEEVQYFEKLGFKCVRETPLLQDSLHMLYSLLWNPSKQS
jgi:hypothetical protein